MIRSELSRISAYLIMSEGLSSLNHKDYFESSIPDTPRIDIADIEKVANTSKEPLYDYVMGHEYKQE